MDDAELQILRQRAPGLAALYTTARDTILRAADLEAVEQARVSALGRRSALTELLRSIPSLPPEERPALGKGGNLVRRALETLVDERERAIKQALDQFLGFTNGEALLNDLSSCIKLRRGV